MENKKKNGGERIFVNNIKETKAGEKAGSIIDAQTAEKATVDKIMDVGLGHLFMLNILIACRERFGILY